MSIGVTFGGGVSSAHRTGDLDPRRGWSFPRYALASDYSIIDAAWEKTSPSEALVQKWLHIVQDEEDGPVFSAEGTDTTDRILIARVKSADLGDTAAFKASEWNELVTFSADFSSESFYHPDYGAPLYTGLADHWHIYAFGYHWIACSLTYSGRSYGVGLVQFTVDEDGVPTVVQTAAINLDADDWTGDGSDFNPYNPRFAPNDLHLVADRITDADGVAQDAIAVVTYSDPVHGSVVFRRKVSDLADGEEVVLDGDATGYVHDSGGSSIRNADGTFEMLAPESMEPDDESVVHRITLSADWEMTDYEAFLDVADNNLTMAMKAQLPDGSYVLAYKKRFTDADRDAEGDAEEDAEGETSPTARTHVYAPESTLPSDDGLIYVILYDSDGNAYDGHIVSHRGNRPHVAYVEGYVLVGWDEPQDSDPPYRALLQVFQLT